MHDEQGHFSTEDDHLPEALPECPKLERIMVSPLGWSIIGRLLCALAASGFLWLSVAWASGWLG